MKKSLLFILTLLTIVFISNVKADSNDLECTYEYYSPQFGYTLATVYFDRGVLENGYITTINSQDAKGAGKGEYIGNLEKPQNFETTEFIDHQHVCPYYASIDFSGSYSLYVSYSWYDANNHTFKQGDKKEAHTAVSSTIEQDKAKNGEAIDATHDKIQQNDMGLGWNAVYFNESNTLRTCTYVSNSSSRNVYGYSSLDLVSFLYDGGKKYSAAIKMYQSHTVNDGTHKQFGYGYDEATWEGTTKSDLDNNKICPAYAVYDAGGYNSLKFTNTRTEVNQDKKIVLISTTLSSDHPDISDPAWAIITFEEERQRAYAHANKRNPTQGDPYGMESGTVGENFCSEPESVLASRTLGIFVVISRYFIPLLIIIWGTFDFIKVLTAGNTDALTKNAKIFGIRVLIGLFVFFFPTIMEAVFNQLAEWNVVKDDYNNCKQCIFHPFNKTVCNPSAIQSISGGGTTNTTTTAAAGNNIRSALETPTTTKSTKKVIILSDPDKTNIVY